MPTPSDFSGVLTVLAPDATAANNAAGKVVRVQNNMFLSQGSTTVGGTTAQNDPIAAIPLFPYTPKLIRNVVKAAGATWTAGQALYVVESSGTYTTVASGNTLAAIAAADATSGATVGDVIPASPF